MRGFFEGALAAVVILVAVVGLLAFQTWMVMLASGALGHVFGISSLFISLWQSLIVTVALNVIGSFFKS